MSADPVDLVAPITLDGQRATAAPRGSREWALDIWLPAGVLLLIGMLCFALPVITRIPAPVNGDISQANRPMWSAHHLLGTDTIGNDVLSRLLAGGRLSLEVAGVSNIVGLILGGLVGVVAGYRRGAIDRTTATVLDVLIAFPSLVLAMVIASGLGPGEWHVIVALAFFSVPAYARLARATTLKIGEEAFVRGARLAGVSPTRTVLTHVAPNVLPPLLTFACLGLSVSVILEASLSFLGLGVRPPAPSWGSMIAQGQEYLTISPSLVLAPSVFLTITVLSLNALAEAGRRRLAYR